MLFTSMVYYIMNGFFYSTNVAQKEIIEGYTTVIGDETDSWSPAQSIRKYGGIIVCFTAFLFHMLGAFEVIPGIVRLVVTYDLDYLAPAVAILYLFFAYQTEQEMYT